MNRRIIAPWKLLIVAFGATLVTGAAAALAIVALSAPGPSFPFESAPQAAALLATKKPRPSPNSQTRVIRPQVTAQTINGAEGIDDGTVQPTPEATPATAPESAQPIARQPAAVDLPPPPPAPTPVPTPTPVPGEYRPDITEELYTMLNNERTSRGLSPALRNSALVSSAEYYARLIFLHDPYDLDHWLEGGPGDRAWSRGYCCGVGEILVESEGSAQGMVDLWMDSPAHKNVILDPNYVSFGLACYDGPYTGEDGDVHHPIVCAGDFGSG